MKRITKFIVTGAMVVSAASACVWTQYFPKLDSPVEVDGAKFLRETSFSYGDLDLTQHIFVDGNGKVNYFGLRKSPDALDNFLATIAVVGPKTQPHLFKTDAARLAYYINAYNAFVLFGVRQRPALVSVHDDSFTFFYGTTYALDGERTNLYDLENKVIRAQFKEPRVHFALNCASVGCPKLPRHAFSAEGLEDELAAETKRFLAEPRNVDVTGDVVALSEIFKWYAEDFQPTPLEWISARVPSVTTSMTLKYRPWDWRLNTQRFGTRTAAKTALAKLRAKLKEEDLGCGGGDESTLTKDVVKKR